MSINRKTRKKGRFIKRNRITIIIVGILFAYLSISLINQQIKINSLLEKEKEALEELESLKAEANSIKEKIEESNNDEFIEKVAREKLKMVKPNEIIYIFKEE